MCDALSLLYSYVAFICVNENRDAEFVLQLL